MHLHHIEDSSGDLVDLLEFCSDYCHRDCMGEDYQGWNGCNESEFDTACGLNPSTNQNTVSYAIIGSLGKILK